MKVMRDLQQDIALRFGVDLAALPKDTRVAVLSSLVNTAVLLQLLVARGVTTDAQLLAAVNAVRNSNYQPGSEPADPVAWDITPVTGF
jgi:hypothetical protein